MCLKNYSPWLLWLSLVCQVFREPAVVAEPFRASAYFHYCRSTLLTWNSLWNSRKSRTNKGHLQVFYLFSLYSAKQRKKSKTTCWVWFSVGVVPKLTELFNKWCDCCWVDCNWVCCVMGWIWPLLLLLLAAIFGLTLRVEFWAGELFPLPI